MKIQFIIKESLKEIIDQLSNSEFWETEIIPLPEKKVIKIKDFVYPLAATAEVMPHEIVIHTAFSNFTYRIFKSGKKICCEYTGAFRGLLEHKLLPSLTPVGNLLDYEVKESSLLKPGLHPTLREYARISEEYRKKEGRSSNAGFPGYPKILYGYYKEDMPAVEK